MPGTVLKAVLVLTHFIATVTLLLNILLHILVVWDTWTLFESANFGLYYNHVCLLSIISFKVPNSLVEIHAFKFQAFCKQHKIWRRLRLESLYWQITAYLFWVVIVVVCEEFSREFW